MSSVSSATADRDPGPRTPPKTPPRSSLRRRHLRDDRDWRADGNRRENARQRLLDASHLGLGRDALEDDLDATRWCRGCQMDPEGDAQRAEDREHAPLYLAHAILGRRSPSVTKWV